MIILLVEDEISITQLIKKGLEAESFSVDVVHDGKEGLAKAEVNRYDLIILDIMLPGIDGIEICKALRGKKIETPIIFLTARSSFEDRKLGMAAGGNDYFVKPFSFFELIKSIKNLLSKKLVQNQNNYTGDLSENKNQSNELCKRILDTAPMSIITIDKQGNITSANKYYENFSKIRDYHSDNIFTNKFFIREDLVKDYKKLLADGTTVQRENCYEKNYQGEDKYLKIVAVPLKDENGQIEGALSMALDNTESSLLKSKLQTLNRDLEAKVDQRTFKLNELNKELDKVLKLQSTFIADVSHELRTSLTIIQGNLELMSSDVSALADSKENYGQIFNEIKRIAAMLDDLISLAGTGSAAASQKINYERININHLISSACKSLKIVADAKHIAIDHKNSQNNIEIMADKSKLEKLLFNLISNAIKYNKKNGWLNVWAEIIGQEIILKVEDSGIGIGKEHMPFIFDRFYRIDKSGSRKSGGSGLGLAIVKWVTELHGGSIDVQSVVGQGTLFVVKLPLYLKQS